VTLLLREGGSERMEVGKWLMEVERGVLVLELQAVVVVTVISIVRELLDSTR